jgi:hypothetical protein
MTGKRFTINNDMNFNNKIETYELNCIKDNKNQTFYFIADSIENVQLFVKRLNELHEEYEELKLSNINLEAKVIHLLDILQEKGSMTYEEVHEWWNSEVMRND